MNITMKQLICEDALYDQKSLIYQDGHLEEIDDPLDRIDVPEGRLGEFRVERVKTKMGVTLQIPVTAASRELADAAPAEDSDTCYRRFVANRFVALEKTDAIQSASIAADFHTDNKLAAWKTPEAGEQTAQWAGLLDTEAGSMLGIIRMISGKDGSVYILRYAGTGNFTDLQMEEAEIMMALRRRVTR